jgi:transposase
MIGFDIAKSVFQVHGEDGSGHLVCTKKLRRGQVEGYFGKLAPAMIGIEACGSSHYWARRLQALGHEVRLIPAAYVKPFVKRNKTDARDAAAICAALGRPDMRFVPVKSEAQQASRSLERSRELLVKQRTQLLNSIRGQMAEFGIVAAQGRRGFAELKAEIGAAETRLPRALSQALGVLLAQLEPLETGIAALEDEIMAAAKANPLMRLVCTVPGVGGLTAHAVVAAIGDGKQFGQARDFSAWAGLTPKENSSGGKRKQGGISKQGENRLRKLFCLGSSTVMRNAKAHPDRATEWQTAILARRPRKVAVLAQAAKTARIVWAVLTSGEPYRKPVATAA